MSDGVPGGRAAALDYGRARIGVAVADDLGILAHPRPFVPARPPQRALRLLKQLFAEENISRVLVGLPLNMDGSEGPSARKARAFADDVAASTGCQVHLVDERLTTVQAHGQLQEAGIRAKDSKSLIDSASAALILQGWLDVRRADGDS